jgi:germination protein M
MSIFKKGFSWLSFIVMMAIILVGCSGGREEALQIDPPPVQTDVEIIEAEPVMAAEETHFRATLFVEDADGYVAPLSVKLPNDTVNYAQKTLEYMVRGGPGDALLPSGFRAILPEGTKVVSMDIDPSTRTATIDFNKAFTSYPVEDERKILEAITWAMTNFPTVDYVQLWVQGEWLKEMPMASLPLDGALSRKFGINLEMAQGVDYSRATPVTLYFQNQTSDSFTYYVPVTRLIPWTEDVATATIAELVKGPMDPSKLESVFLPGLKVNEVSMKDDKVWINFNGDTLTSEGKLPGEGLQAVILSIADSTAISAVQMMVDGTKQALGTDNQNYGAQPVVRPTVLNYYEL